MEILAIELENLASLAGVHTIDFQSEPLASAGIFAITGPTGSGKSTLLDALCLALYGKTPRYHSAKEQGLNILDIGGNTLSQNDPAAILHRGAAEGSASVSFLARDGIAYKATWSIRRARNKPDGRLQASEMSLTNLNTQRPIPGRKKEIEAKIQELIGLTFDQFTRSVLLAQGEFTAFLKADKTEKADLLEKLTGTEIYSHISQQIYERHKREEEALKTLTLQQKGYELLGPEQLQTIKERKEALKLQIDSTAQQLQAIDALLKWHHDKKELEWGVQRAHEELAVATNNQNASKDRERALALFQSAQSAKSDITSLNSAIAKQQQLQQEKNVLAATLQHEEQLVLTSREAENRSKTAYETAKKT